MHINYDRYITTMMIIIIIITLKALKRINIMTLIKILKTINKKFDDNDLFNDNADFKFWEYINISFLNKDPQI